MKKRVLSVLLVIALLVAVGIVAAQANESDPTPAQIIADAAGVIQRAEALGTLAQGENNANPKAKCPLCQQEVTWRPLSALVDNYSETNKRYEQFLYASDHYYMDQDITLTNAAFQSVSGVPHVFLNGKTLIADSGKAAFTDSMTLMGDGNVIANKPCSNGLLSGLAGELNIYGGNYTVAGGVNLGSYMMYGHNRTYNIYGGTIGDPNGNAYGVRPYSSATLNMYGGEITGKGVYVDDWNINETAAVNLYAGSISSINNAGGYLNITGGSANTIRVGASCKGVNISGNPVIGELSFSSIKPTFGALTSGASIGFGSYTGVISTAYDDPDLAQEVADSFPVLPYLKGVTVNTSNQLELVKKAEYTAEEILRGASQQTFTLAEGQTSVQAYCYACGGEANQTWIALDKDHEYLNTMSKLHNKHVFLAEDIEGSYNNGAIYAATWPSTYKLCLHMNGHDVYNKAAMPALRIWTPHTVNVFGSSETELKSAGTAWGGAVCVSADTNKTVLNMYGGKITAEDSTNQAVQVRSGGTANFYGVTVNGTAYVSTTAATAAVNIYSGSFPEIRLANGAKLAVNGGTVGTLTATAGTVTLSGAPTVGLSTELDVDVTGLTGGQISGMKEGVFTTAFASKLLAEAVIPYFTVEEGKAVTVTDDLKLTYGGRVYTPEEIVTLSAQQTFSGTEPVEDWCYACNKKVTWKPLTKDSDVWHDTDTSGLRGGKHFFIANDITSNNASGIFNFGTWSSNEAYCGNWCLHMNGKTLDNAGGPVVRQWNGGCTINVMGDGILKSGAENYGALYAHGGEIETGANAHLNSYFSGELYGYGGNKYAVSSEVDAIMNIYSGDIKNKLRPMGTGRTYVYGANIDSVATDSFKNTHDFYLTTENCTIGTLTMPGAGDVTINGGTIDTIVIGPNGGAPKLVGAVNVNAIDLPEGKVIDMTGMTGGSVNVGAHEGVFTTNFADEAKAAAAAAFVTSPTKVVAIDDLALTTADGKATVINGNNQKAFATYAAAEAAYTEGYIKLLVDENITINKDVTIDFNGQSVDIAGSGKLTGIDSTTLNKFAAIPASVKVVNGAQITFGAPVLEEDEEKCTVSGYLPVTDGDLTTFSYFTMKLSGVALKANPNSVGLYYKGTWNFNDNLPAGKVEAGVAVNVKDQNVENPFEGGIAENTANGYYSTDAASVANGQPVTSVLVNDIMKAKDRDPEKNSEYGRMKIKAAAFIAVNGQEIVTGIKNLSVCDVLKLIEGNDDAYAANETKLANFYNTWKTLANLDTWGLTKIGQ